MLDVELSILLASVVAGATPILLATLGETITEKAGIINLSLDGTILLSAMTAFVLSYRTQSVWLGFAGGAAVGAMIALVVAVFSIYLRQNQVAVGFVLTLMCRDLAYFLGNPYARLQGPQVAPTPIPILKEIPFLGQLFFSHAIPVYFSLIFILVCWWYIYKTPWGLELRAVGEHPGATYARGFKPSKIQTIYAVVGGCFVGLAGATFSLYTKPGWGRPQGAEGTGWIALALVIFGGWHPVKAAIGAYLFAFLQVLGIYLQNWLPSIPSQVFQVAPFPLMIFTLVAMSAIQEERVQTWAAHRPLTKRLMDVLTGTAPASLGKPYRAND